MITLLTGDIDCGKTTFCLRMIEQARAQGRRVGGIITLPGESGKAELWALDVLSAAEPAGSVELLKSKGWVAHSALLLSSSGERRLLARRWPSPDGSRRGCYHFEESTFAWAIAAVRSALAQGVDLLIIDEIGPLELSRGLGFAPLLDELALAACPVVLTVRRGCAEALERRLQNSLELMGVHENSLELRELTELRGLMIGADG